ncbi:lytic transglycosylase domain-containing protein [Aquincola tertiaricarbonis]|uniref:lytic transglycosylase domain-containing protein n=1 Tax=Aquincola tertiaricarbonis TaxID=391953 RepID=UPI001E5043EB|nr:lytic transglycosylase domain-containing protein [Aquincola tertiaricarbonis]
MKYVIPRLPVRAAGRGAALRVLAGTVLLVAAAAAQAMAASGQAAAPGADEELVAMLRADAQRHETGNGLPRDPGFAAALYCRAAKLGDAESQFHLGWMYAHGRGVERQDGWAAWLFEAAAAQGIPQAPNQLRLLGGAAPVQPECLRDPPPPMVDPAVAAAAEAAAASAAAIERLKASSPQPIVEMVMKMAPEFDVNPGLALAIIKAESNFDAQALSPKNAMGLMQLIPETAERFRVKNAFDPKQNIRGGLAYLRWLLAYFEGDVSLVAAAYNAGEGTVERYQGVPPYNETRAYVKRVLGVVGALAHPFDARVTQPSPRLQKIRTAAQP